jgi:aspartyl aminopeptidase
MKRLAYTGISVVALGLFALALHSIAEASFY